MTTPRQTPEPIVTLRRPVEVAVGNGKAPPQACQEAAMTEQTYDRGRQAYGGLMLGYARHELIGLHASDIVVPEEAPHIEQALASIASLSDYQRE